MATLEGDIWDLLGPTQVPTKQERIDTLDHKHLREFVRRRVGDGVVLRLIGKWLKAGVMEERSVTYPSEGSPQGGVI